MLSITVSTDHPIAVDSPDHLTPWGTSRDNSKNLRFNYKVHELFKELGRAPKVLDLGCSGGGFVKTCLDQGLFSVGIEGSDYSRKHRRAEWPLIGESFLFTADITHPFSVNIGNEKVVFDLITAWEVMEHLPESRLKATCENIKNHLSETGLVVLSVAPTEEIIHGQRLHQTVHPKTWWVKMFDENGLTHQPLYESFFNSQYIRGPKQNAPGSFHLYLSKCPEKAPNVPPVSFKQKTLDRWHMSRPQKILQKLLGVESY